MDVAKLSAPLRAAVLVAAAALFVSGCESGKSMGKKIDYKSVSTTPALEIPPDLTTPQYDDRYNTATASGIAAQTAMKPKSEGIAVNSTGDARIVKSGNERWLVVKIAPEQAWNITRQFWLDNGFVLALEQPAVGVMETDWAENRAEIPEDFVRRQLGKFADVLYTTYKRDKFRTRIERGSEAGTVELFVSSRRMEQVPTAKIDNSSPTAFAWALMPPDPQVDAAMLARLMQRFGAPEPAAQQAVTAAAQAPDKARLGRSADGVPQLTIDDNFERSWRRVGLALDRVGFTVVDRDRSNGTYFVRYSNPDMAKVDAGWLAKLQFWKDTTEKPEEYRIAVVAVGSASVVTVQDPKGVVNKGEASDKILALLKDQLK